jgi:hypothetical protein
MPSTLIPFKKTIGAQKVNGKGIAIGEWLVVSYAIGSNDTYQIFKLHDGKLFMPVVFSDLEDAKKIAQWMDETYRQYFPIWLSYPDADIISLAKWSVRNGIPIYQLVNEMKYQQVNRNMITLAWKKAQIRAKEWLRI